MKGLDTGSRAFLDRVLALAKLEQSHLQTLAEFGVIPKNLGTSAQKRFVFRATIEPTDPNEIDAKRQLFNDEMDRMYGYGDDSEEDEPTPAPKAKPRRNKK